jgi:hypothetical protein
MASRFISGLVLGAGISGGYASVGGTLGQRAGIPVGLGTDGAASNDSQNMLEAMKAAALLQKVSRLDPRALTAPDVLAMATIEGARALGLDDVTGSLEPGKRFAWNRYPVPTSDLVAHLVHEHQVGGVNRMVRAQYRIRALRHVGGGVLGKEASAEVDADVREVVRYLLFADEVPLTAGALLSEGDFARAFVVGRKAVGGRSLKDLELRTRLFRHRCSFLVHTPLFAGLDPELRKRVLDGMGMALAPGEGAVEFRYLGEDEKQTIRGILRETVAGWGGR